MMEVTKSFLNKSCKCLAVKIVCFARQNAYLYKKSLHHNHLISL